MRTWATRVAGRALGILGAVVGAPATVLYRLGVPGMKRVAYAAAALAVRGFYLERRGNDDEQHPDA